MKKVELNRFFFTFILNRIWVWKMSIEMQKSSDELNSECYVERERLKGRRGKFKLSLFVREFHIWRKEIPLQMIKMINFPMCLPTFLIRKLHSPFRMVILHFICPAWLLYFTRIHHQTMKKKVIYNEQPLFIHFSFFPFAN